MKVLRLQAENIKRLIAVDITPDGAVVEITGKNGAGKSSVLDSIWYALGGERAIPSEPLRKGAKSGSVKLDLGDLSIERRFTKAGTYLHVANREGARYPNPQAVLDALCGKLTFDPLAFARLAPAEQAKTLAQLVGLDLSTVEAQRKQAYEARRDVNRDVKRLQTELAACGEPTAEPAFPDLDAAERAVTTARAAERAHQERKAQADTDRRAFDQASKRVADIKRQIVELQRQLLDADEALGEAEIAAQASADAAAQSTPAIGVDILMDNAKRAREAKSRHDVWQFNERKRTDKARELAAASKHADKLTAAIDALDVQASAAVQACQFPLPQLTIAENVVRYGDVPFDQCSSAEQLRVSTAIAMRLNPTLRIIRITDGSLLDAGNLAMLGEMATANDYQVWIERVDDSGQVGIVIEAGRVAGADEEVAA